jgi:hypothetical protein
MAAWGQEIYSDICIEAIMMLKTVFKLPYRQTEGFVSSLLGLLKHRRNDILKQIDKHGMAEWKKRSGYHKRSLSETSMFRYKTIHGPCLYSRKTQTQNTEVSLKIKSLNIMTATGMPVSVKIQIKKTA